MKIIDENGNEIINPDLDGGFLSEDKILVARHDAIEGVEEIGHYETVAEYPNGGKDIEWVIDSPSAPPSDAWDEYEDVYRYIRYDSSEIARRKIEELKERLSSTDYIVIKIAEGVATWDDYPGVREQRQEWREEIRSLENTEASDE